MSLRLTLGWFVARLTGDQRRLSAFARTSSAVVGRREAAIRRLEDETVLLEIAKSENPTGIRKAATETLTKVLLTSRRPDGVLCLAPLLAEFHESVSEVWVFEKHILSAAERCQAFNQSSLTDRRVVLKQSDRKFCRFFTWIE